MGDTRPIGVFDSGIGGLTILRELVRELPGERFIYFGDDANCPYGPRPDFEVRELALGAARWLTVRGAKAIVVACNAASVTARTILRETFPDIPIVVVVPAVKPAAALTRSGKIILAATARAINDRFTGELIDQFADGVEVIPVACPGLVDLVEGGQLEGLEPERIIAGYFTPALAAGADVVVLGCTHFPALRAAVERVVGPGIAVIDSGAAVAHQTRRVLADQGLLAPTDASQSSTPPAVEFWTSGDPARFARVGSAVLGWDIQAEHGSTGVSFQANR
ncbi:MAG TPA: glutamate racemase [Ktedonobacterales bacterium]|nr:glutamate racemase [Ktedonobacterales bacterium]